MIKGNDVCGGMVKTCQILVSVLEKNLPFGVQVKGIVKLHSRYTFVHDCATLP